MKKILSIIVILLVTISSYSASLLQYQTLLNSQSYLEQVEITAKWYAKDILISLPNPSTAEEIKRYNWAQDVISSKWNSIVIFRIASFMANDVYLPNPSDPSQIYSDLLTNYSANPSGYTVFDIIGRVNLP